MLGAAKISKSVLGIVGFLVVLSIALIPLVKATVMLIVFHISSAFIHPFVDKRIANCFLVICDSTKLLVGLLSMFVMLYVIQIAFLLKINV